jgi:AbrB family looped-hinge helix DNA binding protein
MAKFKMPELKNYGMATMGERGQVVVPKEIRKKMKLKTGDKFLVFDQDGVVIAFIKPENFDIIIEKLTAHFQDLKKIKK